VDAADATAARIGATDEAAVACTVGSDDRIFTSAAPSRSASTIVGTLLRTGANGDEGEDMVDLPYY
jgi:hypothetical protein